MELEGREGGCEVSYLDLAGDDGSAAFPVCDSRLSLPSIPPSPFSQRAPLAPQAHDSDYSRERHEGPPKDGPSLYRASAFGGCCVQSNLFTS